MVTTHYQELKRYAIETPDVENASCEFDLDTLRPTYRLLLGSPGKSNAFAISQSLGMPEDVIAHAKMLVSTENTRFEAAVDELERARIKLETQTEELERLRKDAAAHEKALREEAEQMEQRRNAELDRIRAQARQIIEQTMTESAALLDELRALKKEKDKADFAERIHAAKQRSRQTIDGLYQQSEPQIVEGAYQLPRPLQIGDTVTIPKMGKSGTVIALPDDKGVVMVQIGAMKTRVPLDTLRLEKSADNTQKKQPKRNAVITSKSQMTRKASLELDIRGCTVDEGTMMVDQFIDGAVMSGLHCVTIIHGKGTGVLRRAIHEHLRKMKHIKEFRLGLYGEGEDGVTIVTLR